MSEGIFQLAQLGRQSVVGTAVAATTVYPIDAGFLGFELDRSSMSPDEDFGLVAREYPGRESTGVRWAIASIPFIGRFQDLMHACEMHFATVTPSGVGPYTYTYPLNETTPLINLAVKPYTLEYGIKGSTQDEWRATGVVADKLDFGFDALSAPGNSPWKGTLGLVALNRAPNTMTAALTPPATLETMEGHLTTFAEGSTATAFAALTVSSAALKSFRFTSTLNAVGRAYGGTTDVAASIGRSNKATIDFTAIVAINASTKTNVLDIFEVAGSVPTERRWRIAVAGSGTNAMTLDARVRFRTVNRSDHEGERLYTIAGVGVYDSTLASRATLTLVNSVAAIP